MRATRSSFLLKKLPRSFYLRPTLAIAGNLLGKYLCRRRGKQVLSGRIVEVEAYLGEKDPASHAYRGLSRRNEVMFRKGGHLYVYFTYGMHFCSNVVTEEEGIGHAVLLRAVEPVGGIEVMVRNRRKGTVSLIDLTNGPAKLCQAFGITRSENGTDLCGSEIWIAKDVRARKAVRMERSSRIGISEGKQYRWRFYVRESLFVSPRKPVKN